MIIFSVHHIKKSILIFLFVLILGIIPASSFLTAQSTGADSLDIRLENLNCC